MTRVNDDELLIGQSCWAQATCAHIARASYAAYLLSADAAYWWLSSTVVLPCVRLLETDCSLARTSDCRPARRVISCNNRARVSSYVGRTSAVHLSARNVHGLLLSGAARLARKLERSILVDIDAC